MAIKNEIKSYLVHNLTSFTMYLEFITKRILKASQNVFQMYCKGYRESLLDKRQYQTCKVKKKTKQIKY